MVCYQRKRVCEAPHLIIFRRALLQPIIGRAYGNFIHSFIQWCDRIQEKPCALFSTSKSFQTKRRKRQVQKQHTLQESPKFQKQHPPHIHLHTPLEDKGGPTIRNQPLKKMPDDVCTPQPQTPRTVRAFHSNTPEARPLLREHELHFRPTVHAFRDDLIFVGQDPF